jgi:hypothetical protein
MRAQFTLLQALLGILTSLFGWPSRAAEAPEDLPWAEVSRTVEKINAPGFIRRTLNRELPGFLKQIEADARRPELLSLWGLSRNIDESHLIDRQKTVPPSLLEFFNSILKVPFDASYEIGHAGLTHTYGYLFSTLETPYGFKRARYVRGEIEAGFGLPAGLLGGRHPEGSLLLNLTLLAGPVAFRSDPDALRVLAALLRKTARRAPPSLLNFDFSRLRPKTLVESVRLDSSGAGEKLLEFRTDLVPFLATATAAASGGGPKGGNVALLIHSIRITRGGKSDHRLITVFPVGAAFGDSLFDPKTLGDAVSIKLRYNAMLPADLMSELPGGPSTPVLTGKRSILP